jgi:ribosomal-protein-alanine N-acetyltransferase
VHYRQYTSADFDALYAIEEACFNPPFRFPRSYMRQLVSDSETATWAAEQGTSMAGFAIVEWSTGKQGTDAYIQTLEVLPSHRGQGIGAELLRRMEFSAQAAGAQSIWLHVDAENFSAIRLYSSHGFALKGREENYYPQGRAALVLFKKFTEAS